MLFVDGPGNDVVDVYVDGALRHTGTSWEDYFRDCESNATRTVDSILFRTGGPPAPSTNGYGFFIDNIRLFSGSAPPPPDGSAPPPPDAEVGGIKVEVGVGWPQAGAATPLVTSVMPFAG
jgi:hypothetical protein